ncbi:DNA translocase FtsK [Rhodoligotrophos defluvii]|uniref:DNA translocase FtsK n=1 Tax=Rhodoligotrophos defluvii TaxID=2561934 RepID=UPI0010C96742|nr:DNA translocase FtsK [Rhodoligotrophos defluvii]
MRSSTRPFTVYDFSRRTVSQHPSPGGQPLPKAPPKTGRSKLDEVLLGSAPVPSWLQQFSRGANARFTRTPDYLLKSRQPPAPGAPADTYEPTLRDETAEDDLIAFDEMPDGECPAPARTGEPSPSNWAEIAFAPANQDDALPPPADAEADVAPDETAGQDADMREAAEEAREPATLLATPPGSPVFSLRASFSWSPFGPVSPPIAPVEEPQPRPAASTHAPMPAPVPPAVPQQAVADAAPVHPSAIPPVPIVRAPSSPPAQVVPPAPARPAAAAKPARAPFPGQQAFERDLPPDHANGEYEFPSLSLLALPPASEPCYELSERYLEDTSERLQRTLHDFGVKGEIIDANPGPVVTLYELEPAPGTKLSRVISVSSDIARSMSAVSARVAVVEGRNIIGIELPNQRRETVWLRELLSSPDFAEATAKLGLCLGKTIGGEPVIADLARMPHLLVAGTTGSGKSVAINTMILSLLYRHKPEDCRLIMIDPKMLELSVYEGIPHLLTPVVTDPKKAVVALKWAVREMEDRYRKMSHLGVRNIDGFNARLAEARAKGETIVRRIQTGVDRETGELLFEEQEMDLTALPYIVVIVDEMADLMMVAGKEIEGAIQRLAQMARAAGIHIVMATQRPSVDVITGTIKANFPTRISFQVTSKIDSRTILGEMGAEQLLGQGDMLYMAGGGRIMRVHGPFVSDAEVEKVVDHLKRQGRPEYLDAVTSDEDDDDAPASSPAGDDDDAVFDKGMFGEDSGDLYEQAVAVVLRDRKASTSYIQRRLKIGYNRAASIMEQMENEGIVGPANHAGKREILTAKPR